MSTTDTNAASPPSQSPPLCDKTSPFGPQFSPRSTSPLSLSSSHVAVPSRFHRASDSAYLCLDLETDRVFVSRHVTFAESVFPYSQVSCQFPRAHIDTCASWLPLLSPLEQVPTTHAHSHSVLALHESSTSTALPSSGARAAASTPTSPSTPVLVSHQPLATADRHSTHVAIPLDVAAPLGSLAQSSAAAPDPAICQPTPSTDTAQHTQTNAALPPPTSNQPTDQNAHPMVTRSKNNIHKPVTKLSLTSMLSSSLQVEPTCVSQALKIPEWRKAMSKEFDALNRNGTWDLVPSHSSHNIVGCKWVFRIKRSPDGSVSRYKARLVAKGFHQRPGLDYTETFQWLKPLPFGSY
ncbi:hypothetical protein LWI29_031925 [Acer saccharum]|uniref:Reverse transcriptase Ty1/copia-type domain-containing protein n=1 Tax=Acer saccharum TaxID=4024 RepID=A0AA39SKW2_ACESA|nr:hypothetical protein LWI29_031925 [Acer saccharum]